VRRAARSGVALAAASLAIGCGDAQPTRVVAPRPVQQQDVARHPPGGPQRSTLELLRAVQFNDPEAAGRLLARSWGLSRAKVAAALDHLRPTALGWRAPRSMAVEHEGPRTASVIADFDGHRVTLRWSRGRGGWRLTGIGARSERLAGQIANVIVAAHHPEVADRPIRPEEDALAREWLSVWRRVLRLGR
jgi:hypothetical protein